MAKLVRAKVTGFFGGARRRPGDVFEIPDTVKLGKWMEEVTDKPKTPPAGKPLTGAQEFADLMKRAKAHGLVFDKTPKLDALRKAVKDAEGKGKLDDDELA